MALKVLKFKIESLYLNSIHVHDDVPDSRNCAMDDSNVKFETLVFNRDDGHFLFVNDKKEVSTEPTPGALLMIDRRDPFRVAPTDVAKGAVVRVLRRICSFLSPVSGVCLRDQSRNSVLR